MGCDIVGHGCQQGVTPVQTELAAHDRPAQQDLEIHFMVGGIHAGGIVHRIRVDAPALPRIFAAAKLGHAQIGAFAHHLGAYLAAIDAHGVIGAVAHLEIGL